MGKLNSEWKILTSGQEPSGILISRKGLELVTTPMIIFVKYFKKAVDMTQIQTLIWQSLLRNIFKTFLSNLTVISQISEICPWRERNKWTVSHKKY